MGLLFAWFIVDLLVGLDLTLVCVIAYLGVLIVICLVTDCGWGGCLVCLLF